MDIFDDVKNYRFHVLAMGGIGMSGIANMLLDRGASVSGSDLRENSLTAGLKARGAVFKPIYELGYIPDAVIVSSAIAGGDRELLFAKEKGILILHRSSALDLLVRGKKVIAVTGSHGKTTTTSLIAWVLLQAGHDPDFYIGGVLKGVNRNAASGKGRIAVVELDESDGSVFSFSPDVCVITNLDREHIDFYRDEASQKRLYRDFIYGNESCRFFIGKHSPINWDFLYDNESIPSNASFYPDESNVMVLDTYPVGEFSSYVKASVNGAEYEAHLPLIGGHNAYNLSACLAVADFIGLDINQAVKAVESFPGVERRMDVFFQGDVLLIHDYAHHPREIKATLEALKGHFSNRRIVAVFEPHRYTRFAGLWNDFAISFDPADAVFCTDIYSASEDPIDGISPDSFVSLLKSRGKASAHVRDVMSIKEGVRKGDVVVFMGAGRAKDYAKDFIKMVSRRENWN